MDETTFTISSSGPLVSSYQRKCCPFNDDGYRDYPDSAFLVTKTDDNGPRRDGLGAANATRPPTLPPPPPSGEPWYLQWKESNAAMWLGHFTFIFGAIFYLKCALVDLAWTRFVRVEYDIPDDILEEDDDDAWIHWEKKNLDKAMGHVVDDMRWHYWDYSSLYCMLGGAFFVVCGFADLLYYCEWFDIFMIFAGIAGVLSAMSDTTDMEGRWNFLSCHMYILEAYVMIRRQHQDIDEMGETYDGHYFFLSSAICFFGGCLMDLITAYIEMFWWESSFLEAYSDLLSCLLWMACAIIDFCAEVYFLESEEEEEEEEEENEEENEEEEGR